MLAVLYISSGLGNIKHKGVCVSLREENLNVNPKGMGKTAKVKIKGQFIIVAKGKDGLTAYITHLKASSSEEANLILQGMKKNGGLSRYAHRIRDSLKILPNPDPNRPAEDFKFLETLPSLSVD